MLVVGGLHGFGPLRSLGRGILFQEDRERLQWGDAHIKQSARLYVLHGFDVGGDSGPVALNIREAQSYQMGLWLERDRKDELLQRRSTLSIGIGGYFRFYEC